MASITIKLQKVKETKRTFMYEELTPAGRPVSEEPLYVPFLRNLYLGKGNTDVGTPDRIQVTIEEAR
jgi:hypothetical protein